MMLVSWINFAARIRFSGFFRNLIVRDKQQLLVCVCVCVCGLKGLLLLSSHRRMINDVNESVLNKAHYKMSEAAVAINHSVDLAHGRRRFELLIRWDSVLIWN